MQIINSNDHSITLLSDTIIATACSISPETVNTPIKNQTTNSEDENDPFKIELPNSEFTPPPLKKHTFFAFLQK